MEVRAFAACLWLGPATRRVLSSCMGRGPPRSTFWRKCLPCSFFSLVFPSKEDTWLFATRTGPGSSVAMTVERSRWTAVPPRRVWGRPGGGGPPSGRGSPPGASAAFSRLLPSLPDSSLCAVSFFLTQPEMACVVEEPPCFLQPETKEQVQGTPGCDQSLLGPGSGSLAPNNHRLRGHLSFLRMPFSSWSQVSTPMERATLQSPDVPAFVGHVPRHGPCPALTHRRAEGWSAP